MSKLLPPLRLTGATILRDGELQQRSLAFAGGRITKGPLPEVDLRGYLILPGIVDLHGDAFERHIAPRPSAPFAMAGGLASTDREAAANGVTTAWLAQSWSWEGGQRSPDYAEELVQALAAYRRHALIDLRIQLRCETHLVDTRERMLALLRDHPVDYVVFNNHLRDVRDAWQDRPEEVALWARRQGRSVEDYMAGLDAALARGAEVPRHLCKLAEAFDEMGVQYGSHDDPDGETRERFSMIGAKICEFPTSRGAAAAARAMNDPVLMGAPNVVRGRSQSGNISALGLVREGLCDALVSDYYYPSLAQAAWALVDQGLRSLPEAWAMISTVPAQIMRLPDRGGLGHGRRADFVVIDAQTRRIEATVSSGRLAYLAGGAATRFLASPEALRFAAE